MTGYDYTRAWFDFAFENPAAKVQHTALYCWIVELNNRLGWKKQFGLPTADTMEGLSIGNRATYMNALGDLQQWGFVRVVQKSSNQHQACVIELCLYENEQAQVQALDKAIMLNTGLPVQNRTGIDTGSGTSGGSSTGTGSGTGSVRIDKPLNHETNKPVERGDKPPSESGSLTRTGASNFTKPTLSEVADYFADKTNNRRQSQEFAGRFTDYYTSNGWRVGKNPMKDWQATVRNWISKEPEKWISPDTNSPRPKPRVVV